MINLIRKTVQNLINKSIIQLTSISFYFAFSINFLKKATSMAKNEKMLKCIIQSKLLKQIKLKNIYDFCSFVFKFGNSQFKEKISDFKQKEYQNQKQLYEQKLDNYQQLCAKLQSYLDNINGSLNKILVQINQQIEKLRNQISNISQPKNQILKEDLILYARSMEQETNENQQINSTCNLESENNFLVLILEQLQKLQFKDQHKEMIKQIQQIMSQKFFNNGQIQILQPKKDKDCHSQKNLSLEYCCNLHGKEFIMTTLVQDYEAERLFCTECLTDVTVKLTTLNEANNQWLVHQGKVFDSNNIFLNLREQKQQKIFEIISQYQQSNKQLQNELFQLLQKQNEIVQNDIQNLEQDKSKQSLMQLDIKNIKNAINILSQKEQLTQALEFQQKLKIEDQCFEKEILKKLTELEQMENSCKLKLQQFLNQNQLLGLDILINIFNKEIQLNKLDSRIFIELIPQLQNKILNAFKQMWKKTIDKGQLYIDYLKSIETNQKDQLEQEYQNIQKYQSIQTQFEKQFTLLLQNQDKQNKILQTDQDLTINSQIIKLIPNKLKQDITQVTQTTQTTPNLNICSKIFTTITNFAKRSQFSAQQVKGIQFTYPIYINFNQPLKFSSTLKHSSITISACGKIAQLPSGGHYLCLCDQPIHRNGTALIKFKVKQISYVMAGICLKDSYNQDYANSHGIGKGCYFLHSYNPPTYSCQVFSHHDPNKNCHAQGFSFQQNDIISMEVNIQLKLITWRNQAKNHVYTLDIQTTSDLYFCFSLNGKNEIELV